MICSFGRTDRCVERRCFARHNSILRLQREWVTPRRPVNMQEPAYQIHSIRAVFFQFAHDQLSYQGISLIEKSGQRPMSEIAIFRQLTFFDTKSEPTGGLVA